jgi:hypothetical protein
MGNKALAILVFCLFGWVLIHAQGIPVQLMVADMNGFEMVDHDVKLRLTLLNDTSSNAGQFQEVHVTKTNDFGIVSIILGKGVSTTNSQVLSLSQFNYINTEPLIKVELDTTPALNQYHDVGYVPYSYPMISRRSFKADSADYSDTAEFAKNFNESFDGDTSSNNEIQHLFLDSDTIRISGSSSYIHFRSIQDNYNCFEGGVIKMGLTSSTPISNAFVLAKFNDTIVVRGYYNSVFGVYQIIPNDGGINTIYNSGGNIAYQATRDGIIVLNTSSGYILNWQNNNNSFDTINTSISGITQWSYPRVYIEDSSVLVLRVANVLVGTKYYSVNLVSHAVNSIVSSTVFDENEWAVVGVDSILIGHEIWNYSLTNKIGSFPNLQNKDYWIHPLSKKIILYNSSLGAKIKIFTLEASDTTYISFSGGLNDLYPIAMIEDELYFRSNSTIQRTINNLDITYNTIFKTDARSMFSIFTKVGKGSTISEFSKEIPNSLFIPYYEGCVNDQWITTQGFVSNTLILE